MSDKKIDVAALRSSFDALAKAVSVVADSMKEFAACLDDPAIMAALQASMKEESAGASEANPWRYFREAGGGIVRVRDGSDSSYFYFPSEPPEKSSIHLEWWLNAANQNPSIWGEITEDEAAKIVGGHPWDQPADV